MRDPRAVLDSIPGFAGAELGTRLSGGPTNNSFRVEQDGKSFVLRLDKSEATRLGLDRKAELNVIQVVAEAGLGAHPIYWDVEAGVCIRPYVPGRAWTRDDLLREGRLERLATLLRTLHALPAAGNPFKPLDAAARYARQLGSAEAKRVFENAADAFTAINPPAPALCHNDLVCQNILEGDSLTLIDWEYAGMGDPFFDLAVVVQHHGLSEDLANRLLSSYLQRDIQESDRQPLAAQRRFYKLLLELWTLRVSM